MDAGQSVTSNFVEEVTIVTIDPTINDILALTGGEDLLRECLGDETLDAGLLSITDSMTLVTVQPISQEMLTNEMIDCLEAELAAIL